jgi:hypothetical protein
MKEIEFEDVQEKLSHCEVDSCQASIQTGKLVYHTGIYKWRDGTFHDTMEEDLPFVPINGYPD